MKTGYPINNVENLMRFLANLDIKSARVAYDLSHANLLKYCSKLITAKKSRFT